MYGTIDAATKGTTSIDVRHAPSTAGEFYAIDLHDDGGIIALFVSPEQAKEIAKGILDAIYDVEGAAVDRLTSESAVVK